MPSSLLLIVLPLRVVSVVPFTVSVSVLQFDSLSMRSVLPLFVVSLLLVL